MHVPIIGFTVQKVHLISTILPDKHRENIPLIFHVDQRKNTNRTKMAAVCNGNSRNSAAIFHLFGLPFAPDCPAKS